MRKVYGERWEIVSDLDSGGQAHVYRVEDLRSPEYQYALKKLKNDRRVGRMANELRALQQIEHPNVVRVVDHHVEGNPPYYLVMELLEGGTLADRVEAHKGDIVRSLELFCAICDGVVVAHQQKHPVIHRDLKPENVLFRSEDDDSPVVADFGLCWMENGTRFTASQEAVGAFHFMAPELEDGRLEEPTEQCDVYSLGKLLYYLVSGGVTFSREKHRDREYDLRYVFSNWGYSTLRNVQLEYVSTLLDRMIVADPGERCAGVTRARDFARVIARLVREGHYPFTDHMPCKFCGEGVYERRHPKEIPVLFRGVIGGSPNDIAVALFRCNECGHFQLFDCPQFVKKTVVRAQG